MRSLPDADEERGRAAVNEMQQTKRNLQFITHTGDMDKQNREDATANLHWVKRITKSNTDLQRSSQRGNHVFRRRVEAVDETPRSTLTYPRKANVTEHRLSIPSRA